MAEPFQRGGRWYGRVKDAAGAWRNVVLAEARTKAQARELQAALALQARRQRDGLEPLPSDRAITVGALLGWWLDTYVTGKSWAGREEDRFRLYFQSTDLVRLPVVTLTAGRLELFLQDWSRRGLAPASINKLRAMVRTADRGGQARQAAAPRPRPRWNRRRLPARLPALQAEGHTARREAPRLRTAQLPALRDAPVGQGAASPLPPTRHAAHDRDAAPLGGRRPLRGSAHPPAHGPQGDVRDLRAPRARLPARANRSPAEARAVCCISAARGA